MMIEFYNLRKMAMKVFIGFLVFLCPLTVFSGTYSDAVLNDYYKELSGGYKISVSDLDVGVVKEFNFLGYFFIAYNRSGNVVERKLKSIDSYPWGRLDGVLYGFLSSNRNLSLNEKQKHHVFWAHSPYSFCIVHWDSQKKFFFDPCTGSVFDKNGVAIKYRGERWDLHPISYRLQDGDLVVGLENVEEYSFNCNDKKGKAKLLCFINNDVEEYFSSDTILSYSDVSDSSILRNASLYSSYSIVYFLVRYGFQYDCSIVRLAESHNRNDVASLLRRDMVCN